MNTTSSSNNGNNAEFADFGMEGDEDKPFPVHCLPKYAQNYLSEICRVYGVCASLPGACMLGTLSMAVGSGVELFTGKHNVRANLFVLGAAMSGFGKSIAFDHVVEPSFLDYEKNFLIRWRQDVLPGIKAKIQVLKRQQASLHKQASKQPVTADTSLEQLTQIERELAELENKLHEPCMTFSEATREKIADLVSRSPRETLASVSADGRGCVNVLMGRYNSKTDEDVFVALWTGDYYKLSRINRPDSVLRRPCLSLLWLTQPDRMYQLLSHDGMSDSGFLARTLLFEASPPAQVQPSKVPIDQSAMNYWKALVFWVTNNFYHRSHPETIHCDPEVIEMMERFSSSLYQRQQPGGDLGDVGSFVARWAELTWRIMLVLHVGKLWGEPPQYRISIETAWEAIQLMDWFATQQLLLLTAKRKTKHDERFAKLVDVLRAEPGQCLSFRDLLRNHHFRQEEVRMIAAKYLELFEFKDLKAKGPGRSSPGIVLVQE